MGRMDNLEEKLNEIFDAVSKLNSTISESAQETSTRIGDFAQETSSRISESSDEMSSRISESIQTTGHKTIDVLLDILQSVRGGRIYKVKCASCKGGGKNIHRYYGEFKNKQHSCIPCNGSGYVNASTNHEGNMIECVSCNGAGLKPHPGSYGNDDMRYCSAFNGTGYA